MNLFGRLYDKTMHWSKHQFALYWLILVSFIEAIFFPIPPDVMLVPMSMSKPKKAKYYALYCGLASTAGGIIGYCIGYFGFDLIESFFSTSGYKSHWDTAINWFQNWGILVIFVAGFSPIPYKVFTICAGVMNMAFLPFVITAFISRTARFFLVAKLSAWGGERFATQLRKYIEIIGWAVVVLAICAYFLLK